MLALLPLFLSLVTTPASQAKPNVLVIVGDDIGHTDLQSVPTPNIDALAARGVSFDRAYSMPTCSPSRYALIFGKYRGFDSGKACGAAVDITPDTGTFSLPKLMKNAGYATGLFGKWHVGSNSVGHWAETPRLHGFDVWRAGMPMNVTACGGSSYWNWKRVDDGRVSVARTYCTLETRDAFREWWKGTEGPKFAYVPFAAPHAPFHRPPDELLPESFREDPARTFATPRDLYEAMLVSLDTAIGGLLSAVELENTWVVFLGDNGTPGFSAEDRERAKSSTFEAGVRVPLVVAGPGVKASFRSTALVHVVDLLATISDVSGAALPGTERLDSTSFAGVLRDPEASPRSHVYCALLTGHRDQAVVTERWKLRRVTRRGGESNSVLDGIRTEWLYDLENDPEEREPLDLEDEAHREILVRLRGWMETPAIEESVAPIRRRIEGR